MSRSTARKLAFTGVAFALAGALVLGLAELALRLFGDAPLYMAHPVLGGTLRPGIRTRYRRADVDQEVLINAHGFHDEEYPRAKPPGTRRVLLLGDSFMEALQVGIHETFAKVLQRCLTKPGEPVQVVNAGRSGRGCLEEYLFLRHAGWSFEPDVVLVAFVMNDVDDDWARRDLIDRDREGRPLTFRAQGLSPLPLWLKALLHRSWAVYRLMEGLSAGWQALRKGGAGAAVGAAGGIGVAPVPGEAFRILRPTYDAETEAAWAFSLKSLELMNDECRARKVPLVLMIVPLESSFDARTTPTTEFWKLARANAERPHRILAEFCARHGIPLLDLLPGLRACPKRPLHANEGHWNADGNAAAAALACEALTQLFARTHPRR